MTEKHDYIIVKIAIPEMIKLMTSEAFHSVLSDLINVFVSVSNDVQSFQI